MIPQIAYGIICIFWAYANARGIKANVWIFHGANGYIHLAFCIFFGIEFGPLYSLMILFQGRLLFDIALNLFRGLPLGYVPLNPKSKVDIAEKWVFEKPFYFIRKRFKKGSYPLIVGILPKILYAAILIILIVIHY